jgi:hypothetical protein
LFFVKYNYGLMWILPMAWSVAWRREGSLRNLARRAGSVLGSVDLRRPFHLLVLVVLVVSVALRLTGPWRFSLAGHEIRGSSAGGLLWGLYMVVVLRFALRPRRSVGKLAAWWRHLDSEMRSMVVWIAAPIGLWMMAPSHAKGFISFIENRSSGTGLLSIDSLLYYPRVLVHHYGRSPVLENLILALAAVGLVAILRYRPAHRPLALALLVGTAAVAVHPYKDPRFAFTVAPLLWLCAGWSAAAGVAVLTRLLSSAHGTLIGRATALLPLVVVGSLHPVDRDFVIEAHRVRTVSPSIEPVLDLVASRAAASRGSVLLGHWNELSPGLVEWHCYRSHPGIRRDQIPRWLPDRLRRGDVVSRLASDATAELVFVVGAAPGTPVGDAGFAEENQWLNPVRTALLADPRFIAVEQRRFPETGYSVTVLRRR